MAKAKDRDDIMSPDGGEKDEFGGLDKEFGTFFEETKESPEGATTAPIVEEAVLVAPEASEPAQQPAEAIPVALRVKNATKKAKRQSKPETAEDKPVIPRRQKAIRIMLKRAGKDQMPELSELLKGKTGDKIAIKDIALFIGEPEDETLAEVAAECPKRNRVNLSAEVQKVRVLQVGAQIIEAGRMYLPIQVVKIEEDGALECTSGCHRLAFLALAYGPDAEIPINIESMTMNEARDAVVVANDARPTKALERAEHAVMKAVGGNIDAEQDELYSKTATTRIGVRKYCIFSVLERKHPARLTFKLSQTSSRRDGGLTTITNVENFWNSSLEWTRETERKEFDTALKASVKFLNELVDAMKSIKEFNPSHHLASMTLAAVGKYYREYGNVSQKNAVERVADVAKEIVGMGEIGRYRSEKICKALQTALPPKK